MEDRVGYILLLYILLFDLVRTYEQKSLLNRTNSNESLNNFMNNLNDLNKLSDTEICKIKTCINKCCPENKYVLSIRGMKSCVEYKNNFTFDFSSMYVYNKDMTRVMTTVGNSTQIHLVPGKFLNDTFKKIYFNERIMRNFRTYLTEDGVVNLQLRNMYERWILFEKEYFCVDYQISRKGKLPTTRIWMEWYLPVTEESAFNKTNKVNYKVGTLESYFPQDETSDHKLEAGIDLSPWISCVFLFTVLVFYCLLPELRNLCGLIPIAFFASLFWAFLLVAIIQCASFMIEDCIRLTLSIYFFFMSSFCWLNVMSYDVWWTFSGHGKAHPNHRLGEYFKFAMYCLYAWGLPFGMTIFTSIMNTDNFEDRPWIIQPNIGKKGCFIEGPEKILYMYSPIFFFILSDWLFHLMTAFNVWRLRRDTGLLDSLNSAAAGTPAPHHTHRQRFMVYLKVSIVMGLSWALEVGKYLIPDLPLWNVNDTYNMLMGLFIFLIFFCKTNIYKKWKKRFEGYETKWPSSTKSFANSSNERLSTPDAGSQVVYSNLSGPTNQKL